MVRTLQKICLALLLLTAAGGRSAAAVEGASVGTAAPLSAPPTEPPSEPLTTAPDPADLPEPPPAPLVPQVVPPPPPVPARPRLEAPGRVFRNTAWTGVAITLALFTTGTVFGLLTQQRADSLGRSTTQRIDGLAPIYDTAQQAAFTQLQSQGQTYNNVTIGCFFAGGATALVSAILFWNAGRLTPREGALALIPSVAPRSGTVTLVGSF